MALLPIIVTYNPDNSVTQNALAILKQTNTLLIVDNGSSKNSLERVKQLEKQTGITIIYNEKNLGIAEALNIGAREAIRLKYEWLATFDQDTLVPENYFKSLLTTYDTCKNKENIGILFPVYRDHDTGVLLNPNKTRETAELPITSGSLVKIDVFTKVGFFQDSYFIDYVDHEFALRVLKANFIIYKDSNTVLDHSLGNIHIHSFLGRKVIATHHSALRRFYMTRNRIITWKKYALFNPKWFFRDFSSFIKETIKIIFLEENKLQKIKNIFRGFFSALSGTMGKIKG